MISSLPEGQLTEEKVIVIQDLIRSDIFQESECRLIILPQITHELKDILERSQDMTKQENHNGSTAFVSANRGLVELCTKTYFNYLVPLSWGPCFHSP